MKNNCPFPLINSIHGTAEWCKAMDIGLSEGAIRRLIKSGALPHFLVGNKVLINRDVLLGFLECNKDEHPPLDTGAIRRLDV